MTGSIGKKLFFLVMIFCGCQQAPKEEALLSMASDKLKISLIEEDAVKVVKTTFVLGENRKFGRPDPQAQFFAPIEQTVYRPVRIFVSGDSLICWFWLQLAEQDSLSQNVRYATNPDRYTAPFVIIHPQKCRISQILPYPLGSQPGGREMEATLNQIVESPGPKSFELSLLDPFLDPNLDELSDYFDQFFPEWENCSELTFLGKNTFVWLSK